MLNYKVLLSGSALLACVLGVACSTDVAGGVSEETNSVAGILTNRKGNPVAGAEVLARHVSVDTLSYVDTTDEKGRFAFPLRHKGVYGISVNQDTLASYTTIEYLGKNLDVNAELKEVSSFEGNVVLGTGLRQGNVEVRLPGTDWISETDSTGVFRFDGIPVGAYTFVVSSPDTRFYLDASFVLDIGKDSTRLSGPLPSSASLTESEVQEYPVGIVEENVVQLPYTTEYGLVSWWSMDYLSSSGNQRVIRDSRGHSDGILLYGGSELVEGVFEKAVSLKGADQFGVVENDNGALAGVDQFTLELFLWVDSLSLEESFRKNIVGKIGFGSEDDRNVFSLAMINQECGVDDARLTFFLADGSGDSLTCSNAVVSSEKFDFGTWMHVVVVFESGTLKLYRNGVLDQERKTSVTTLQESSESIFFGKENLNIMLDDVRLGEKAITSADVLYRYNLKGGAL